MSDNILDFTVPQDTNLNVSNELSHELESNAEHDVQSTGNTSNKRSSVWEHFTEVPDIRQNGKKKAKCNYCPQLIVISGTSGMWNHLGRCTKYNNGDTQGTQSRKRRKIVKKGQVVSSPSCSKFDQEACRAQLVRTFVCAELPFRFVEHEEFRKLLIILQPRFDIPSRYTLRRDIWALYIEELGKLKKVLKNCGRVSLTTDTWTSNQNLSYMSLTVHFVDRELKLHKKIINFCQITGHTGDMLGKYVDTYLRDWGLYGKILTVTVDNAKANDVMIRYLHNMMSSWDNHVLKEARMPYKKEVDFDILGWWKANLTRYPILASIAREVLAIPASTVASESAFSTGGRVVSDYRTCLTPKMVEALVCTQDWLKGKALHLFSEEDLDEIHRLEKEITSQESVNLDD